MLSVITDLFTVLFLQVFASKEQKREVATALQRNSQELRGISAHYRASGAMFDRMITETNDRLFAGYTQRLNQERRLLNLPPL